LGASVSILCGMESGGAATLRGGTYALSHFAFVVAAPILALAGAMGAACRPR
jgi:hypothetical protein